MHIRCSFHIFSCAKIENRLLEVRLGVMGIGETYFSCGRDQLPHLIRVVMYKTLFAGEEEILTHSASSCGPVAE